MTYRQWEIWWTDLEPAVGTEQKKHRPCLIISAPRINQLGTAAVVAPLVPKRPWPWLVPVTASEINNTDGRHAVDCLQIRYVDPSVRFTRRLGELESTYHEAIRQALRRTLP